MTLVNIDLRNQGYETGPDDRVIFYSLLVREGDFGTISTAPVEVPLVDGKATVDLAPGPVGVQIIAGMVADTRVREGRVPMEGPTTLNVVLTLLPEYSDAVRAAMIAAIERARDEALGQVGGAVESAIGTTTSYIASVDDRHANKIVRLNDEGKLFISTSSITEINDPVNKQYADNVVGTTTSYASYTDTRFANQIVRLNDYGKIHITTSGITGLNDPTNKQYVDSALGQVAGAVDDAIGTTTSTISMVDDRHANKIVRLNDDGKLHITTSSITGLNDPVNKQYADNVVGTTASTISYTDDRFANQIVRLNGDGKLHITTASITGLYDPVNKKYVDDAILESSGGQTTWWN